MDVRMPDGTIIKNVPEGTTQTELLSRFNKFKETSTAKAIQPTAPTQPIRHPGATGDFSAGATGTVPQPTSVASDLTQLASNIPGSAVRFAESVVTPFLHPQQTAEALASAARGAIASLPVDPMALGVAAANPFRRALGLSEVQPSSIASPQDIQAARNVAGAFSQRFGGLQNIRRTAIQDPVGLLADVAGASGLVGLGLRSAGLARAANVAGAVSRAIDPFAMTTKAVTGLAKPVTSFSLGVTTGTGRAVMNQALEGGKTFRAAMRGKLSELDVKDMAIDSLDNLRNARGSAYRSGLEEIKNSKIQFPIDDIKQSANDFLDRFNVEITPTGELDFSRSTLTGQAATDVKSIYEDIKDFGSKPGDATAIGLDTLKRRLQERFNPNRQSRAMATALAKQVKQKIVNKIPQYASLTADYEKATDLIKDIEQAFSLKTTSSADTVLNKFLKTMREDKTFRRSLLNSMEQSGGENLQDAIAGLALQPRISTKIRSLATTVGPVAANLGIHGISGFSPSLLALLPLASPRLAGEFMNAVGRLGKVAARARPVPLTAFQAGRAEQNISTQQNQNSDTNSLPGLRGPSR